MRLSKLTAGLSAAPFVDDPDVTGISTDSRSTKRGDVFVAIRGGQIADRHPYIAEAVAAGASAVVLEELAETGGVPSVKVASSREALAEMAVRLHGSPADKLRMVGITGTNGKTTTAYLIRSILDAAGLDPGLIGTIEYRTGSQTRDSHNSTPEAHVLQGLLREMVDAGCRSAVMEATSHGLALDRIHGISFEAGVFTNLTRDHLDYHETYAAYRAAKARLFENLSEDAHAVLNADDPASDFFGDRCGARQLTYGTSERATYRVVAGETDFSGTRMTLATPTGRLGLTMALAGQFNLLNAAAAATTGIALGLSEDAIVTGIRDVRVPGRFEPVSVGQPFGVFVDYAHTPDALENVLRAARPLAKNRVIALFGCGGDRDRGKRPEMGRVSAELADLTIVTSDNPRTEDAAFIVSEILPGLGTCEQIVEVDRRAAIDAAIGTAEPGDIVVIAGKGHEDYQIVGDRTLPFDDREEARRALKERGYVD